MIPQLSSSESLTNELDVNHFFVAILFLGLILGSIGGVTHNYVFWLSNVVMWGWPRSPSATSCTTGAWSRSSTRLAQGFGAVHVQWATG